MTTPHPGRPIGVYKLCQGMSNAKGQSYKQMNILKRDALYFCDPSGKLKISFRSKHGAAGGAGEDQEYAQIWERQINRARRCLGKGAAADKLVLDSALEQVLGARGAHGV